MMILALYLRFPPTVNNYYARSRHGVFIKAAGKRFRQVIEREVIEQHGKLGICHKMSVKVILHPTDRRTRDLDNYMKALLDACTHAGVWEDDKLIDQLQVYRGEVIKGGSATVIIDEAGPVIPSGDIGVRLVDGQ